MQRADRSIDSDAYRIRKPLTIWYRVPQISPSPKARILWRFTTYSFLVTSKRLYCGGNRSAIKLSIETRCVLCREWITWPLWDRLWFNPILGDGVYLSIPTKECHREICGTPILWFLIMPYFTCIIAKFKVSCNFTSKSLFPKMTMLCLGLSALKQLKYENGHVKNLYFAIKHKQKMYLIKKWFRAN